MKNLILLALAFTLVASADTPPPGTVKAKMFTGDGVTGLTATGTSLNVNVTNSSGGSTVNQGAAGGDPWLVYVQSSELPANACQETGGNLAAINTKTPALVTGRVPVDGSGVTQPVSGTFWQATQPVSGTFYQATQPVSLATLPALTTGAATIGAVNINGTVPVSGTVTATNAANGATAAAVPASATQVGGKDGAGNLRALSVSTGGVLSVDGSGSTQPVSGTFWQATQPVSASSLPLPSGAATEATLASILADTGAIAASVDSIDTKTPALVTGRVPVDGSGVTQPVSGTFWQATQPVSGTVTANAGSGTFVVNGSGFTQPVSGTFWQATQPVSGTVTANIGTSGSLALDASVTGLQVAQGSTTSGQKGELIQGAVTTSAPSYTTAQTSPLSLTTAGRLRIDGSGTTQPVSGTVTANAGTGTFAVDASGFTVPVSGTFWQATQPVSGTFYQATQPVSIASLPSLAAGSALIGKVGIDQTTPGTTNGVQVNAALPAGSNVIGAVKIDQTTPGTTNLVALAANQSVNLAQVGGGSTAVGHGTAATALRVELPTDGTGLVNAAQSGSWSVTQAVPTAVTVKQAAITIGTSAVRLTTDGSAPSSTRRLLVAQLLSTSTAACYFGSSSVTSSSTTRGVQMFAGQTLSFNNDAGDYYAICDASAQTFYITEQE